MRTHLSVVFQSHVVSARADTYTHQSTVEEQARAGWELGGTEQAVESVGNWYASIPDDGRLMRGGRTVDEAAECIDELSHILSHHIVLILVKLVCQCL